MEPAAPVPVPVPKLLLSLLLCAATSGTALAAENGQLRVLPGAMGYEMALPMLPGVYGDFWYQRYGAKKLRGHDGQEMSAVVPVPGMGDVPVAIKPKVDLDLYIPRLTWMTEQTLADGRLGFGLALPVARVDMRTDFQSDVPALAPTLAGMSAAASGKQSGQGDLEAGVFLDWPSDTGRYAWGLSFSAPTGDYDRNRAVNPGQGNYWTVRPLFMASHVFGNQLQVGTAISYNFNSRNDDTGYRTGQFVHADFMLMASLGDAWRLGLQGFATKQTTEDHDGRGALTDTKTRAFGIGPSLAFVSDTGWGADLKVMKEYGVRNKTEGTVGWFRLHLYLY